MISTQTKAFGVSLMILVRSALICDEKKILDLIENGSLLYAFNVGIGSKNQFLRVLTQSLVNHVLQMKPSADELNEEKTLRSILPAYESMSAVKVGQLFCLTGDQVACILRDGQLTEMGRRDYSCQSPKISRESVYQFLKRRRILRTSRRTEHAWSMAMKRKPGASSRYQKLCAARFSPNPIALVIAMSKHC